jgi:hypothetical protein
VGEDGRGRGKVGGTDANFWARGRQAETGAEGMQKCQRPFLGAASPHLAISSSDAASFTSATTTLGGVLPSVAAERDATSRSSLPRSRPATAHFLRRLCRHGSVMHVQTSRSSIKEQMTGAAPAQIAPAAIRREEVSERLGHGYCGRRRHSGGGARKQVTR